MYQISPQGEKSVVPSSVKPPGGGGDETTEWTNFWLDTPIDESAQTAAILRYAKDTGLGEKAAQAFDGIFRQHRTGRFEIECRILDGERLLGEVRNELEVLFKEDFFDQETFRKP